MKQPPIKKILLLALLFLITANSGAIEGPLEEYRAKSSFLFRMCKYAQWPQSQELRENPHRDIVIGVLGTLPEEREIIIPRDIPIEKRYVLVIKIKELDEISKCDVLFIAATESYRLRDIMIHVGDKPILTVADTTGFCKKGVILGLFIKEKKIRFEFNPGAAKKARIEMDSFFYLKGIPVKTEID